MHRDRKEIDGQVLTQLIGLPLTSLKLNNLSLAPRHMELLCGGFPLRYLHLHNCHVSVTGVRYLHGLPLRELVLENSLDLKEEEVRPVMEVIASLRSLHTLDMASCGVHQDA
jgi:hypothetical protein